MASRTSTPVTKKQTDASVLLAVGFLGLVVLAGTVVYFVFYGEPGPDAQASWIEGREKDLRSVAERLMAFASANGNRFPRDAEELARSGVLPREQARFRDAVANCEVQRQYRPAPVIRNDKRVIVILENYDPNPNANLLVVYSDGEVGVRAFLETTVSDDNMLRQLNGLKPLEWAAP